MHTIMVFMFQMSTGFLPSVLQHTVLSHTLLYLNIFVYTVIPKLHWYLSINYLFIGYWIF